MATTTQQESVEQAKAALQAPRQRVIPIEAKDFVSTGCTLMNLAASDRAFGGFAKGKYYFFVGDSSSGKTWLMFTCFAEAARNPAFSKYRLIYDATTEDGAQMDIAYYFGKAVADRLEVLHSQTAEEFLYNLDDAVKSKRPCIYACDSENGLDVKVAKEKFAEDKALFRKGKEKDITGSYRMDKPKLWSQNMPRICADLRDSGSILLVASQTRDNITGYGGPRTRSGGRALRFYATLEFWSSIYKKLERTVNGQKRQIGVEVEVEFKKNRFTGKDRSVMFPIYWSHGIDDVGGNVDFLIAEKHWAYDKDSGLVTATEFDMKVKRETLIKHIEKGNYERVLARTAGEVWKKIEDACVVDRKARY